MKIKAGKLYHSPNKEICLMPTIEAANEEYCFTSWNYADSTVSYYTEMYGSVHLIPANELFMIIEEIYPEGDVVKVLYQDKTGYLSCVLSSGLVKEYRGKRIRNNV